MVATCIFLLPVQMWLLWWLLQNRNSLLSTTTQPFTAYTRSAHSQSSFAHATHPLPTATASPPAPPKPPPLPPALSATVSAAIATVDPAAPTLASHPASPASDTPTAAAALPMLSRGGVHLHGGLRSRNSHVAHRPRGRRHRLHPRRLGLSHAIGNLLLGSSDRLWLRTLRR